MKDLKDLIVTQEDPYATFEDECSTKLDLIQLVNRRSEDLSNSTKYATLTRQKPDRARQLRVRFSLIKILLRHLFSHLPVTFTLIYTLTL